MSGSMGDMGNLLAQAQKMQQELDRVRTELRDARVEGIAAGVVVTLSGDRRMVGIDLERPGDRLLTQLAYAQHHGGSLDAAVQNYEMAISVFEDAGDRLERARRRSLDDRRGGTPVRRRRAHQLLLARR